MYSISFAALLRIVAVLILVVSYGFLRGIMLALIFDAGATWLASRFEGPLTRWRSGTDPALAQLLELSDDAIEYFRAHPGTPSTSAANKILHEQLDGDEPAAIKLLLTACKLGYQLSPTLDEPHDSYEFLYLELEQALVWSMMRRDWKMRIEEALRYRTFKKQRSASS